MWASKQTSSLPPDVFQLFGTSDEWYFALVLRASKADLHRVAFPAIEARIMYKICLLVYKSFNIVVPKYLADIMRQWNSPGSVQIRSSARKRLVETIISGTVSVNRSIKFSGPRLFNSLPKDLQDAPNVTTFKKLLKTFFLWILQCWY